MRIILKGKKPSKLIEILFTLLTTKFKAKGLTKYLLKVQKNQRMRS